MSGETPAVREALPVYVPEAPETERVPPGYRRTEVGVIPEDWEVVRLSDLVTVGPQNGYSGRSGKDAPGTPTLSLAATTSGHLTLNEDTVKRLYEVIEPGSSLFLKSGDLLVQRSNTLDLVGTTAVFDGPPDVYVYPDLMMRLRFRNDATAHWFWRYANSAEGRRYFVSIAAGSTGSMPKISGERLRQMPLPAPPLPEQRAIAAALSDVDALLSALDRLIAKKRAVKTAAMQQLLTGKQRLPGFTGEWEVKRLGDVSVIKTGNKNNEDKVEDGRYPFFVRSQTIERINTYSFDGEAILVPGEGGIGSIFHYVNGKFDYHQRVYKISDFSADTCGKFIYYSMIQTFNKQAMRNSVKATVDSLRLPTFLGFEFLAPAFAAVLSDMDAEIEALEARREKTRQVKQGMMQELLTGRTRLV
ncbi:MAG: Type I restriction-modification system, specificity subunit S [uncultured Rubrobacteraceae bacterium]|uniref:Type I restriction-modification system, specificity subunit S n=1 Tax=uncultured Rubrobacteraceae bacterium TaxID=349277 RepID=A0A6J4QNR3_9ACTN|nr:MAG: Type I restriction-modification system, specificity subunit S [uncultured Rubrobacteraceae bacterium]